MINLPPHKEYWKSPPRASKGDDDAALIFVEVGRSLSSWELVESIYSKLFGMFVGGSSAGAALQAAEAAYGTIASHGGRVEMLKHAANVFFAFTPSVQEHKADWDALLGHFKEASGVRNYIAHGVVTGFAVDQTNHGYFLEPPAYNSLKTDRLKMEIHEATKTPHLKVKYSYISKDIFGFQNKFSILRAEAQDYYMMLFHKLAQNWPKRRPE